MNLSQNLLKSHKEACAAALLVLALFFVFTHFELNEEREIKIRCMENIKEKLPMWGITGENDWKFGKSENIEIVEEGGYIKLKDGQTSGKWVSAIKDWGRGMEYYYVDVDSQVSKGAIKIDFQVSDDNFKTIKDSIQKNLSGGLEKFSLCNLENSTSMRLEVRMRSKNSDKELTTLHGIWIYIKPLSNRTTNFTKEPENYSKEGKS